CSHTKTYSLDALTTLAIDSMHAHLTDPEFIKARAKAKAEEFARLAKQEDTERKAAQKHLDRLNVQIARLAEANGDRDTPVKELMESIKAKEIERVALQERIRLLGAETNVTVLHPSVWSTFSKNVETLHAKLKKNPKDPECRLAFANVL